jgi:hypothetical protein
MDTVLRLKKQWALRCVDGKYTITNEMIQLPIAPEFEGLMIKLAKGVEPGELEDQEFEKLERVNHLLSQDQHPDAPAWEMGGAYFHSVQQQLEHVTLFVYDRSTNGFGADLELRLLDAKNIAEAAKKVKENRDNNEVRIASERLAQLLDRKESLEASKKDIEKQLNEVNTLVTALGYPPKE